MARQSNKVTVVGLGRDAVRAAMLGLPTDFLPTRGMDGEPSLFIPDAWDVEIVRVGHQELWQPRMLPSWTRELAGGRRIGGSMLHVPKGMSVVLGRNPHPMEESERDDKLIGVQNGDGSWNLLFDFQPTNAATTVQMRDIDKKKEDDK